jgi:DNA-directed RNA polymerase specialized sigma24 family protein
MPITPCPSREALSAYVFGPIANEAWEAIATHVESCPDCQAVVATFEDALELVRSEFEDHAWEAFQRVVVAGQSPSQIAADLGMSLRAIYKAKSRALFRLRQRLDGLTERVNRRNSLSCLALQRSDKMVSRSIVSSSREASSAS